ncbi:hypothetical protein ACWKW6_17760 [Dyadobacter jiangsuensis]
MKQLKIAGTSLKYLLAIGLLTACNHDDPITPTQNLEAVSIDKNAKISSLLRLVEDGDASIQYFKTGKFKGRISYIDPGAGKNYCYKYNYDDNNPAGDLWITKRLYNKSGGQLVSEMKFKVVNGLCVLSEALSGGSAYFSYNAQGQLDEITIKSQGNIVMTAKYSYLFDAASNTYRLDNILRTEVGLNYVNEYKFAYSQLPDKYPLNYEIFSFTDKYLPIYGKFSDVLVSVHSVTLDIKKGSPTPTHYLHTYTTDSDGLATMIETKIAYGNNPPAGSSIITNLKYSTAWQGI